MTEPICALLLGPSCPTDASPINASIIYSTYAFCFFHSIVNRCRHFLEDPQQLAQKSELCKTHSVNITILNLIFATCPIICPTYPNFFCIEGASNFFQCILAFRLTIEWQLSNSRTSSDS